MLEVELLSHLSMFACSRRRNLQNSLTAVVRYISAQESTLEDSRSYKKSFIGSLAANMSAAQLLNPKAESRVGAACATITKHSLLTLLRGEEKLCESTSTQVKVCKMY